MLAPIALAFLTGFSGSYHCLGMCGPLQMGLLGNAKNQFFSYQTGRWLIYSLLGALVALLGIGIYRPELAAVFSLLAGLALLMGIWKPSLWHTLASKRHMRVFAWASKRIIPFVQQNGWLGYFAGGALHGLLPCGLLYLGLFQAAVSGSMMMGVLVMSFFFLGTLPALLFVYAGNRHWQVSLPRGLRQISFTILAILLMLRGMNLGIPFISPELSTVAKTGSIAIACHK